jgi:hypothetical protein
MKKENEQVKGLGSFSEHLHLKLTLLNVWQDALRPSTGEPPAGCH